MFVGKVSKGNVAKNNTSFITCCLLLLILLTADVALGNPSLVPSHRVSRHEAAPLVEIAEDPGGNLAFETLPALGDAAFKVNNNSSIALGRSDSAFWLRFKLKAPAHDKDAERRLLEVGNPGIRFVDLYVPVSSGEGSAGYTVYRSGLRRGSPRNDIISRTPVLELPTDWDADRFFYLRVKGSTALNFSLSVWSHRAFIKASTLDAYAFGALYGLLIGMMLFNLALFFYLGDRAYLYYVLYMFSILWCETILYGQFRIFFDVPAEGSRMMFFAACGTAWVFSAAFSRGFLNTRVHAPFFDRMIVGIMACGLLVPVFGAAGLHSLGHRANELLGIVALPVCIGASVSAWRRRFYPAGYFLAAWLILVFGIFLYAASGIFLPRSPFTVYTLAIGSGLEAILLSLALADRIRVMKKERERFRKNERRLKVLAETDGLTGLYNKRFMLDTLDREWDEARENETPLSLVIMDVDNFKHFNDTHGHPEGDKVLKELAGVLKSHVRDKDSPCRFGGEEFVLILPLTGAVEASGVAERIRSCFEEIVFQPGPSTRVRVTVSMGLAELKSGEAVAGLVKRADEALYRAKHEGKNRVVSCFNDEPVAAHRR